MSFPKEKKLDQADTDKELISESVRHDMSLL